MRLRSLSARDWSNIAAVARQVDIMSKGDEKNGKRHIYNMVSFYDTYTSPEFQSISERLRLHEFVQLPTAQIEDGAIVQLPIAQITN